MGPAPHPGLAATEIFDLSQVCDGTEDCPPTEIGDGGEDEEDCGQTEGVCKIL